MGVSGEFLGLWLGWKKGKGSGKEKQIDCCIFCRHAITFMLCLCM